MHRIRRKVRFLAALAVIGAGGLCACDNRERVEEGARSRDRRTALVDFPAVLQPDDATVAAFVHRVIDTCVAGDYEEFRLLWSAREDPFPRDAFERGWRAVRKVSVINIQKFRRRAEDDIVYGVYAKVELDDSVPEPHREVVLLVVKEADDWRLVRPPSGLRNQLAGTATTQPATQPASQPSPVPEPQDPTAP